MAITAASISVTCADGRPLQALADLIEARSRLLHETASDATVAVAIDALKSIRAATRKFKGKIRPVSAEPRPQLSVTVREVPHFRVAFRGARHRFCIVDLAGNECRSIRPAIRVPPAKLPAAKVFRIELSDDRTAAWPFQRRVSYMVAESVESAQRIVQNRFERVARRSGSLGRDALSRAMGLVSTRPAAMAKSPHVNRVLSRPGMVVVTKSLNGHNSGDNSITIEDNLRYALDALPGGEAYVNTALARAANSVAGLINHRLTDTGSRFFNPSHRIPTPFPASAFDPEGKLL